MQNVSSTKDVKCMHDWRVGDIDIYLCGPWRRGVAAGGVRQEGEGVWPGVSERGNGSSNGEGTAHLRLAVRGGAERGGWVREGVMGEGTLY